MPKVKIKVVYEFEEQVDYETYYLKGEEANIDNLKESIEDDINNGELENFSCGYPEISIEEVEG